MSGAFQAFGPGAGASLSGALADVADVTAVAGLARDAWRISSQVRGQAVAVRRASRTEWRSRAADAFEHEALEAARRLDRCADLFADLAGDLVRHARAAQHRAEELTELARRARQAVDGLGLDDYLGRDT